MSSSASAAACPLRRVARGRNSAVARRPVRSRASSATCDRLAHGELGEERRRLEGAAEPAPGAAGRRACADTSAPSSSTVPVLGTKPPMAFISVDLPAPLVPISPTISPAATSMETPSTALTPPKRTVTSGGDEGGAGGGRARPRRGAGRRRRDRRSPVAAGPGPARRSAQREQRARAPVGDLDEPAGEVEQQDEQAEARREQRRRAGCRGRTRAGR